MVIAGTRSFANFKIKVANWILEIKLGSIQIITKISPTVNSSMADFEIATKERRLVVKTD